MAKYVEVGTTDPGEDIKIGNHNVGIGTDSPAAPLHVKKNASAGTPWIGQIKVEPADDNSDAGISLMTTRTDTDRVWSILAGSGAGNTNLRIWDSTAGAERISIDNSGYVGIGSTSPSCALDVVGDVKFKPSTDSTTAVQVQKSDGTNVLNVDTTNSRVGIGVTTPSEKLDVFGKIKVAAGNHSLTLEENDIKFNRNDYAYIRNDAGSGSMILFTVNNKQKLRIDDTTICQVIVYGNITCDINSDGQFVLPAYSKASLPAGYIGGIILVTDESGGVVPAFYDGSYSVWRRVTDRAIVS